MIEELATEVKELIANAGQGEEDIHTDCNAYHALKRKIDNPNSCHNNDNVQQMKDLHSTYLLGISIQNRQKRIDAAHKVATATAATTAIATSNVANTTSISSYATSAD